MEIEEIPTPSAQIPIPQRNDYQQSQTPRNNSFHSSSYPLHLSSSPSPSSTPKSFLHRSLEMESKATLCRSPEYKSRRSSLRYTRMEFDFDMSSYSSTPSPSSQNTTFNHTVYTTDSTSIPSNENMNINDNQRQFSQLNNNQFNNNRHYDDALPSRQSATSNIRKISLHTVKDCIDSKRHIKIIDCRYPFEHKKGHLNGAENIWNEKKLFEKYPVDNRSYTCPFILLFYCEYSTKRAPEMAMKLREADIQYSVQGELVYNNIFVIDKGMKGLFRHLRSYCFGEYIEMKDKEFDCEKNYYRRMLGQSEGDNERRRSFSRTRSLSLLGCQMESSDSVEEQ